MSVIITINGNDYYSYASVEDADIYLTAQIGTNWDTIDTNLKSKYLITATRKIDAIDWKGIKVDEEQPLQFPRLICDKQTDDKLIEQTAIEIASNLALLYGSSTGATQTSVSNIALDIASIKSMKVGDTDIHFKDDVKINVSSIDDLISSRLSIYAKGLEIWL